MLKMKPQYWPPDVKSRLTGKDPDTGENWRQEEKGVADDEIVGWHHWLNGHEFEQAPRDGEGHGSLACCSPWGHKESNTTEWLKNSKTEHCNESSNGFSTVLWSQLLQGNTAKPVKSMSQLPQFLCSEVSSYITSNVVCNTTTVCKAFCKSLDSRLGRHSIFRKGILISTVSIYLFQ